MHQRTAVLLCISEYLEVLNRAEFYMTDFNWCDCPICYQITEKNKTKCITSSRLMDVSVLFRGNCIIIISINRGTHLN